MNFRKPDITGVILAGGQSRRMGFNKANAEMHGESMLIRMIDKLKGITPEIIVSTGNDSYPNIQLPQISDEHPLCGPMGGIYSVLKVSNSLLNLVVSCDMPLASVSLLEHIVTSANKNNSMITVPVDHNGQMQMLCAVYHKDVLPFLKKQIDNKAFKMKSLLDLVSVTYINISKEHPHYNEHTFMNVNDPNILEEARQLWNNQK